MGLFGFGKKMEEEKKENVAVTLYLQRKSVVYVEEMDVISRS